MKSVGQFSRVGRSFCPSSDSRLIASRPHIFISIFTSTRSHRSQVGGSPTASYLFCFAKKGNPKKATTLPLAFGFPIEQDKKWESFETRLRLKQRSFLYPFSVLHNWQCQKWVKVKGKVKNNGNGKTNSINRKVVQLGQKNRGVIPAQAGIQ